MNPLFLASRSTGLASAGAAMQLTGDALLNLLQAGSVPDPGSWEVGVTADVMDVAAHVVYCPPGTSPPRIQPTLGNPGCPGEVQVGSPVHSGQLRAMGLPDVAPVRCCVAVLCVPWWGQVLRPVLVDLVTTSKDLAQEKERALANAGRAAPSPPSSALQQSPSPSRTSPRDHASTNPVWAGF